MATKPAVRLDEDDEDFIVRVRRNALEREEISKFVDFLLIESIRKKSKLTEEEAAEIADEIDRAVWEQLRPRYEEK